jgi:hypothetical protein
MSNEYVSVGDQFLKREKTLRDRLRVAALQITTSEHPQAPEWYQLMHEAADALEKTEHTLSVWVERVERLERELEELKR